jgi:DegV family protein with EDD domain
MSFAIVVDSTNDFPQEVMEARGIHVVPLYVAFGEDSYKDGVEIQKEEFYEKLKSDPRHPTTSQPTIADFVEAYKAAKEKAGAEKVMAIVVSNDVSGTHNSAIQAVELVDFPVEVIDSRIASLPLAYLAFNAAEARDAGKSFEETVEIVKSKIPKVQIYFTVATLEYLHRGGRIGGAAKFIGEALKIKPIMKAEDGQVGPVDRVRTAKRALMKIVELVENDTSGKKIKRLGILHAQTPEDVEKLKDVIADWDYEELDVCTASSAVGTHGGPGLYGLCYEVE